MISFLKKIIFKKKENLFPVVERKLDTPYFMDNSNLETYKKQGFVVIKNGIPLDKISELEAVYKKLTTFNEYKVEKHFINSGRFQSIEIRKYVMDEIGRFSGEILPTIFNDAYFDTNTTGAFQIKPPSKISELNPHQDAPVIDETKYNGLFVWIPLCDITEKNGAVYVLPGSHLWGNHQRSLNVAWIFEEYAKLLWKHMQPVYMQKGDVLCWDSALIHASSPNLSDEMRIAVTSTILPKGYKMVEYFKDKDTPDDSVEKYEVERSFWETEDIMKRPCCPPNKFIGIEKMVFKNKITKTQLRSLITHN